MKGRKKAAGSPGIWGGGTAVGGVEVRGEFL